MTLTLDRVSLAQGQTLLSELSADYSSILKTANLQQEGDNKVVCRFNVPGLGERTTSASTSNEAIRLALIELASILTSLPYAVSGQPILGGFSASEETKLSSYTSTERFQSKTRQVTLGVTMPIFLKEHLSSLANSQNISFAEISRMYTVFGYEDFEEKSLFRSSTSLFVAFKSELYRWQSPETEQVMLRLDAGHAVRIRSAAKEYKKSASELCSLFMSHGLFLQEQLIELETKVSQYKGPAIRKLVVQLGLGSYATPILSGILVGSVRAPKSILKRLESFFNAPDTLLALLFKSSFDHRIVPAFKAESGKPEVLRSPSTWSTAVKSLHLTADQTKALLDLENERT